MSFRNLQMLGKGQRETMLTGMSSFALRIAGLICTFGLGVALARLLGPAEFGIYGLVTSIAALAMTVSLLGTPQLAVRELSVRSAQGDWVGVKALIRRFSLVSTTAALTLGAAAFAISFAVPSTVDQLSLMVFLGALLTLATTVTGLAAAELRGLGAMLKGQFMDIAGRPAAAFLICVAVIAVGAPLGAIDALWIQVAIAAAAAAISLAWIRSILPKWAASARAAGNISWAGAAVPLWLVDVLRQVDGTYGLILMGWFASAFELGVYRVAFSCVAVVAMPVTILHIIQAPAISKLYKFGDRHVLQQLLSTTSAWMVMMVAPIALAAWLIGRPAIAFVFGAEYAGAWLPLFILCLSQLILGFFGMGPILLAMCDGEKHLIKIYMVAVGLAMIAAVPLVIAYGAAGAASAIIISYGLIGVLSWRYGKRHLGVDCTFLPLLRGARAS